MKKLSKTSRTMFISLGAVALLAVLSVSFAFFTVKIESGELFNIKGEAQNNLPQISLIEATSGVSLDGTYPMPDAMGLATDAYEFTITNDETAKQVKVSIILEVTSDSTLSDALVRYDLNGTTANLGTNSITPSATTFKSAYKLTDTTLDAGGSVSYSLRTWIDENATVEEAQNKTWSSKILVVPEFVA